MPKALTLDPELTAEMARGAASFPYFLRHHVSIRDVLPDGASRVTKWEWWDFHDQVVQDLGSRPRLVLLKARQLGFSWLLAALHLWDAMFTAHYLGGDYSAGQAEANEFLDKCRFIYEHLPYPGPSLVVDNSEELRFGVSGGAILAFPSTTKAGRGYTFNRVTADEAAFHQWAEANYAAYEPATEHGQIVLVSSAGDSERTALNDWFQRMWLAARDGSNGFLARFYPWHLRPGRDEAWKRERQARLSSRPGAFEREYPETPEQAFASMLRLRFDEDAIAYGLEGSRAALGVVSGVPEGLVSPWLRVWVRPRPGLAYVAYTDAAEGKGLDYCCTYVAEARTLRVVACLRDNVLEPTEHGALAVKLCRWYNVAYHGTERNRGEAILYLFGQERYPREYWHEEEQSRAQRESGVRATARLGFPVTDQTRTGLLDDLAVAVQTGALDCADRTFWEECGSFIVTERGRAEAAKGTHDDCVMAMAGLVRMARQPGATVLQVGSVAMRPHRAGRSYEYRDPSE